MNRNDKIEIYTKYEQFLWIIHLLKICYLCVHYAVFYHLHEFGTVQTHCHNEAFKLLITMEVQLTCNMSIIWKNLFSYYHFEPIAYRLKIQFIVL